VNVFASEDQNKIAILVNDNVITNYDIEQRVKIFAISNQVQLNAENGSTITNKIVDELIDNLLKVEKIEEYNIEIDSNDLYNYENQYFISKKIKKEDFLELLRINNVNEKAFYNMLHNDIAWQILISRLYYRITSVSEEEINDLIHKNPELTSEMAERIIMDKQLALKSSKMLRDLRSEATIEYKQ
tara:strand:+ start:158 stop:715 length:558 start_codon:yes stop_codon:yes gene_type:complete